MEISELSDRLRHDDVGKFVKSVISELNRKPPNGASVHLVFAIISGLKMRNREVKEQHGNISFEQLAKKDLSLYQGLMERIYRVHSEFGVKM